MTDVLSLFLPHNQLKYLFYLSFYNFFSARHSVPCACPAILPPVLGGDFMNPPCQYCLLGPCVMVRPPPLLWGNAGLVQGNNSFKRHYLYNQLYGVLRELKVWLHPHYLMQKQLTCGLESREIMPNCIVHVSQVGCISWGRRGHLS